MHTFFRWQLTYVHCNSYNLECYTVKKQKCSNVVISSESQNIIMQTLQFSNLRTALPKSCNI
jgi:hypothetical protein